MRLYAGRDSITLKSTSKRSRGGPAVAGGRAEGLCGPGSARRRGDHAHAQPGLNFGVAPLHVGERAARGVGVVPPVGRTVRERGAATANGVNTPSPIVTPITPSPIITTDIVRFGHVQRVRGPP